jgi:hypothetical protein
MNPPTKASPAEKLIKPAKNCSHNAGKGNCSTPNNVSLIHLMPITAMIPGIKTITNAAYLLMSVLTPLIVLYIKFSSLSMKLEFANPFMLRYDKFVKKIAHPFYIECGGVMFAECIIINRS